MKSEECIYRGVIRTLELMKKSHENLTENATRIGILAGELPDCPVRMKTYEELYQYYAAVMQMTVEALEEVQQYQELGTVRELKALKERSLTGLELAKIAVIIQKFKKYEEVGTVEECQEARERQVPKKVMDDAAFGLCPCCHTEFNSELLEEYDMRYCIYCGQAIEREF